MMLLAAVFSAVLMVGTRVGPGRFLATFALTGAVLLWYSALGALGAAVNSRAAGVTLIVAFMLITQMVPGVLWTHYQSFRAPLTGPEAVHYALYIAPWWGLSLIHNPRLRAYMPTALNPPSAPPVWLVTTVLYLVATAATLALAELLYKMSRRQAAPVARPGDERQRGP